MNRLLLFVYLFLLQTSILLAGPTVDFSANFRTICAGTSTQLAGTVSAGGPVSSWAWTFTGGTPFTTLTFTGQYPSMTFTNPGVYDAQLVATDGSGSTTVTKTGYITVSAAGKNYNYSVNVDNHWKFMHQLSINFGNAPITSPPTIGTSPFVSTTANPFDGASSISNSDGDFLFTTNGKTVWDRYHNVMPNGTGLFGTGYSLQTSLIVPFITDCSNKYYIFTASTVVAEGLSYSVVDMSLNNGLGAVEVATKNTNLLTNTMGKLTATLHCNGKDVWIVVHLYDSDQFKAFRITAAGINPVPVTSAIGSYYPTQTNHIELSRGEMKISPNGKYLALSIHPFTQFGQPQLFDFDNGTGIVSNPRTIPVQGIVKNYIGSVEFSPDSKLLYINETSMLVQRTIGTSSLGAPVNLHTYTNGTGTSTLVLGPDDKIYFNYTKHQSSGMFPPTDAIGAIRKPNLTGAAADVNPTEINITPERSIFSLNNCFISKTLNHASPAATIVINKLICHPAGNVVLDPGPGSIFEWSTGASSDEITVNTPGMYTVKVTDVNGCFLNFKFVVADSLITKNKTINITCGNTINLANYDDCPGQYISWSIPALSQTLLTTQVSPIATTVYRKITYTDSTKTCIQCIQDITVVVAPSNISTVITRVCPGKPLTISPGSFFCNGAVAWELSGPGMSPSPLSGPSATISSPVAGVYTITAIMPNGCRCETRYIVSFFSPAVPINTTIHIPCGSSINLADYDQCFGFFHAWGIPAQNVMLVTTTVTPSPGTTVYQKITYSDDEFSCITCIQNLTVITDPIPPTTIIARICPGNPLTISPSLFSCAGGVAWEVSGPGLLPSPLSGPSATIPNPVSGTYTITTILPNGCRCETRYIVDFLPPPVPINTVLHIECGTPINLADYDLCGGFVSMWGIPAQNVMLVTTTITPPLGTTVYQKTTYSDGNMNCITCIQNITVIVTQPPVAVIHRIANVVCGQRLDLDLYNSCGNSGYSEGWIIGTPPIYVISNPVVYPVGPMVYQRLVYTDDTKTCLKCVVEVTVNYIPPVPIVRTLNVPCGTTINLDDYNECDDGYSLAGWNLGIPPGYIMSPSVITPTLMNFTFTYRKEIYGDPAKTCLKCVMLITVNVTEPVVPEYNITKYIECGKLFSLEIIALDEPCRASCSSIKYFDEHNNEITTGWTAKLGDAPKKVIRKCYGPNGCLMCKVTFTVITTQNTHPGGTTWTRRICDLPNPSSYTFMASDFVTTLPPLNRMKWYNNGVLIPGMMSSYIISPVNPGTYKFEVYDEFGCLTDVYTLKLVACTPPESGEMQSKPKSSDPFAHVYPNPNSGMFNIDWNSDFSCEYIEITDNIGRKIYTTSVGENTNKLAVDLSHVAKGIYFVELVNKNKVRHIQKVVIH